MNLFIFLVLCFTGFTISHSSNIQQSNFEVKCVHIHEQPSLSHPLLKDHKIQMKPSLTPKSNNVDQKDQSSTILISNIESKNCPSGMVPIQTIRKSTNLRQSEIVRPLNWEHKGVQYAVVMANGEVYYGVKADINLPNPQCNMDQYSMGQIWVSNYTSLDDENSISVGYSVHPKLYGDYNTHLTSYWTADGFKSTGCFDATCPGFVQVHPSIHLGARFANTTLYGAEDQYCAKVSILHDQFSGHWWVFYNETEAVGYFPKEIFNNLGNGARLVRYGGYTMMSPEGASPAMGNGQFPNDDPLISTWIAQLHVADNRHELVDVGHTRFVYYISNPKCFNAKYIGRGEDVMGYWMTFGGPGGVCGD